MSKQRMARPPIREVGPLSAFAPFIPEWVLDGADHYSSAGGGWSPKVSLTIQGITQDGPDDPQITRTHTFRWTPAEAREWAERILRMVELMEQPYEEVPADAW